MYKLDFIFIYKNLNGSTNEKLCLCIPCFPLYFVIFIYCFLLLLSLSAIYSSLSCSSNPSLSVIRALSKMTLPSLYLWLSSVANSYIHPSLVSQLLQKTSRTMCLPVIIILSWMSLYCRLTTCNKIIVRLD